MKFTQLILVIHLMILASFQGCSQNNEFAVDQKLTMTEEELNDSQKEDSLPSGNIVFSDSEYKGMKLFMTNCNKCHPGGEKGVGPSLNDKKLPDFLIHSQVRVGLGKMPSFNSAEISKEEVKKIILFVRLMRDEESNN